MLSSLGAGVISGIVASLCFSVFLLLIKPKVRISNEICREKETATSVVYRIKIVNHTYAILTNLKYTLHYCKMRGDGINEIIEIKPRKTPLISIDKNNLKKNNTDYAVRISYDIDLTECPLDDNCKLIFTFIADHSWSNTTKCIRKEYRQSEIIDGVFESDKSVKIIRSNY